LPKNVGSHHSHANRLNLYLSMRNKLTWVAILFVICYIPLHYFLGKSPIVIWDEALYAKNALEMSIDKDFLVLHNDGKICTSNEKPPLVIWLQCICIWLMGPSEIAIRFPTALASFFTCLAMFFFAKYSLKNEKIGLFAVLFLITSRGIIRSHIARTGDLDCMLMFWITAYSLLTLHFLLHKIENYKPYFRWIGLFIFLAFMTKSVAGLMPVLGLLMAAIALGRGKEMLSNAYTYRMTTAVLGACVGYYLLRGWAQPGYLSKAIYSDYTRFFVNIMPWHTQPADFYITIARELFFKHYFWFLPLTLLNFFSKEVLIRRFMLGGLAFAGRYFCLDFLP
jgi:4-amino-4-deoxy-L-arabinose transferase-like glycosyltransferase